MYNNENENNELNINEVPEAVEAEVEDAADTAEPENEVYVAPKAEVERKPMTRRAKYKAVSGVMTALVVAAVIVVNLLIGAVGTRVNTKIDITAGKILDFADETIEAAKSVENDVTIYSLIPESNDEVLDAIDQILTRYSQLSSKIKYVRIDTQQNPEFLQKYTTDAAQFNMYSVIFERGDKFRVVDVNDTVTINQQTGQVQSLSAEQRFTSALMYVSNDATVKVGVIQGHNEIDFANFNSVVLEPENFDAVEINLLTGGIPADVNMLIIPAPQRDFTPDEINALDAYFDRGGNAQLIMNYLTESLPNLEGYLAEWGVTVHPGFVVEESSNKYVSYPNYIIPDILSNEITEGIIANNLFMIYPTARGMKVQSISGVESMDLLKSSDTSFVRTDFESQELTMGEGDIDGSAVIATMLTRYTDSDASKFMILGGTGVFEAFSLDAYANKDFYYNSMAYMTDSKESIYIRPKNMSPEFLLIPAATARVIMGVTVVLIPLLILIAGFVVWNKRRHL